MPKQLDTRVVEATKDLFVLQIYCYSYWHGLNLVRNEEGRVVDWILESGIPYQLEKCAYSSKAQLDKAMKDFEEYTEIGKKLRYKEPIDITVALTEHNNNKPSESGFFRRLFGCHNS